MRSASQSRACTRLVPSIHRWVSAVHPSVSHPSFAIHSVTCRPRCFSIAPLCAASSSSSIPPASTPSPDYATCLHTLLNIHHQRQVQLGLAPTKALIVHLGQSYRDTFPTVHVAGSNGKGSVTHKIAKALEMHGLRVGTYTSPHLSSFRERMCVNGVPITESELCTLLPPILAAAESQHIQATMFELTTVLALKWFNEQHVDCAVFEVGLG